MFISKLNALPALPPRANWAPPPLARLRWQVPLILLSAALLPALILGEPDFHNIGSLGSSSNTFAAAALCSLLALFLFRRLGTTPGVSSFGQIIPAVAVPFLTALVMILAARLFYSRPFFAFSALNTSLILAAIWVYQRRHWAPLLLVLPSARLRMSELRSDCIFLDAPLEELPSNSVVVADLRADIEVYWEQFLLRAALQGVPVYHVKQIKESLSGKVEVEHLSENAFGSVAPSVLYLKVKRCVDLLTAVVALPFLFVLFPMLALAIRLDSPGSIFFVQERMGFRGHLFNMVKFRTMRVEASSNCPNEVREGAKTLDGDLRVTRVGRILRKYRLDELPQIVNVLRGEMSWIGPRPEAAALSAWYHSEIPFYAYRHMVRPGITGWAQVNQGHVFDVTDVKAKLHYDFYYIKYFSAWLDALIALRTLRTLLVGAGAK